MQRTNKLVPTVLIYILLAWVFGSAFYYAGNLISGDVLADRSSDHFHKVFKYFMAFIISFAFMLAFRLWSLFLYYAWLILFLTVFLVMHLSGLNVLYAIDIFIVLISFSGFIFFIPKLGDETLIKVIDFVIASAIIVSVVSFLECFFMEPILGDYWRNTGGYRSISTLLNPNNLGLYLGAASLFLIFSDKITGRRKLIILPIFFVVLLMSGSRTAFISFFSALFLGSVFSSNWRVRVDSLLKWQGGLLVATFAFVVVVCFFSFEVPERAVNMETAVIRIGKYFEYISNFDLSYILPDFDGRRIEIVSESAYFYAINAVGVAFFTLLVLVSVLVIFMGFDFTSCRSSMPKKIFGVVFVYYTIASLFENVLMSFPNNQLFFISAGGVLAISDFSNLKSRVKPA